jgi:4-hydroxyphenylpyruvate dioxygenase
MLTILLIVEHGNAVRAVTVRVEDAAIAFERAVQSGAVPVMPPHVLNCRYTGKSCTVSEIRLFGDGVLRFLSGEFDGPALPNYEPVAVTRSNCIGLSRIDHIVNNVPKLFEAVDYLMAATGFHEFSEFTAEDVGTVDSGLNSMVLTNNNEFVLLPVNEPTFGTPRKSQIQNFLEHNNGAGVQHIALKTDDIFHTMREMKKRAAFGGFDFMPAPGHDYYLKIPSRIGENVLSAAELEELEALGLLADKDDQGVLLQVFTQPVGDRPTVFFEIIQRVGCDKDPATGAKVEQAAGCGGFGKGNFSELFKSIENFEKMQDVVVPK